MCLTWCGFLHLNGPFLSDKYHLGSCLWTTQCASADRNTLALCHGIGFCCFLGPILQMLKTESTKDRLCTKIGADNVRLVGRYPPKIVAAGSKTRGVCMCRGLLEKGPLKRALHSTNMLCQTASDLCHCINKIAWLFQPSKNFSVYTIGSRNKQGYKKQTRVLKVLLNGLVVNHLCVKVISVYTFNWYSNHWWYCFVFV